MSPYCCADCLVLSREIGTPAVLVLVRPLRLRQASAVQFVNSAVSATTSSYTSQCMHDFVPVEADLVLVEFSVNDWEVVDASTFSWMDNSLRQGTLLHI